MLSKKKKQQQQQQMKAKITKRTPIELLKVNFHHHLDRDTKQKTLLQT